MLAHTSRNMRVHRTRGRSTRQRKRVGAPKQREQPSPTKEFLARGISNIESSQFSFSTALLTFHLFDTQSCMADSKSGCQGYNSSKSIFIRKMRIGLETLGSTF